MAVIPVTVVGPRHSGKTVFLASLFRRLALQRDDVGFFAQVPAEQMKALNAIYNRIDSPTGWPDPTHLGDVKELDFTCSVRTAGDQVFTPFAIRYLDFAGEHLTHAVEDGAEFAERSDSAERVWKAVEEAKFLLVLLDGVKVERFFAGDYRLVNELIPILGEIQRSKAVVHFVITKWDVLEEAGRTLREVLDCLMGHPDFKDAFDNWRRRTNASRTMRLIPVSSVGRGFATPAANGIDMIKKGAYPRPLNVEVPFMAVLVDLFDGTLKDLASAGNPVAASAARAEKSLVRIRNIQKQIPAFRRLLGSLPVKTTTTKLIQENMLDALADYMERRMGAYGDRVERDLMSMREQVYQSGSQRETLTRLVKMFEARLAEFEVEYPGSLMGEEAA